MLSCYHSWQRSQKWQQLVKLHWVTEQFFVRNGNKFQVPLLGKQCIFNHCLHKQQIFSTGAFHICLFMTSFSQLIVVTNIPLVKSKHFGKNRPKTIFLKPNIENIFMLSQYTAKTFARLDIRSSGNIALYKSHRFSHRKRSKWVWWVIIILPNSQHHHIKICLSSLKFVSFALWHDIVIP